MTPFTYVRAEDAPKAISLSRNARHPKYLGGGTNLVDLMRETIEQPDALVDVTGLSREISSRDDGGMLIGAAVTNTALAADRAVRTRYPLLSRAILAGASGQIRNMATVGGNILQRTRCAYFYDDAAKCNKRVRGAGCDAVDGFNRNHGILGTSRSCVATHPSDMCIALVALDATLYLDGPDGKRESKLADFHRLPGDEPDIETELRPHELIVAIELPALPFGTTSTYRKIRDRASYAFALVSVAAAIDIQDGKVRDVRIALGGVAPKPWRAQKAESWLRGRPANEVSFKEAAEAELLDATGLRDNAFKIELTKRAMVSVLGQLTRGHA